MLILILQITRRVGVMKIATLTVSVILDNVAVGLAI